MTIKDITDPFILKPVTTADGRPWCQRCYVCVKSVNFIKDPSQSWVRVGELVRHKKCLPPPAR